MSDQEENELVDRAFAPNNGMPPFPGLDLFNPVDRAFWYGDGSGGMKLLGGGSFGQVTLTEAPE